MSAEVGVIFPPKCQWVTDLSDTPRYFSTGSTKKQKDTHFLQILTCLTDPGYHISPFRLFQFDLHIHENKNQCAQWSSKTFILSRAAISFLESPGMKGTVTLEAVPLGTHPSWQMMSCWTRSNLLRDLPPWLFWDGLDLVWVNVVNTCRCFYRSYIERN